MKSRLCIREFSIDLAASKENAVCATYYNELDDSLREEVSWNITRGIRPFGRWAWCNPPYANIAPWTLKAMLESKNDGAQIVMLVPASVGANWWRNYVEPYAYVAFLNGRLTFVGETTPYPKDCALLFYTPWGFRGSEVWDWRSQPLPQLQQREPSED